MAGQQLPPALADSMLKTLWGERHRTVVGTGGGLSEEEVEDVVGLMATDTATIDLSYNDGTGQLTADVVPGSIGPTQLAATAVSPGTYTYSTVTVDADGRITAASSGTPGLSSVGYMDLPTLGLQMSSLDIPATGHSQSSQAPYVAATGCVYAPAGTASKVNKINNRTGLVTSLTPPITIGTVSSILWDVTLGLLIISGAGAGQFCTLDPATDTFSAAVAATNASQSRMAYSPASGYLYYSRSTGFGPARMLIDGSSNTMGATFSTAAGKCCFAGTAFFVLEGTTPGKIWKYAEADWPTATASLVLPAAVPGNAMIAYNPSTGNLLIGGTNGNIWVVNPTTMLQEADITLSGVTSRATHFIHYDPASDRIFAYDAANKIWFLDAATGAVLGWTIPTTTTVSSGLAYDYDRNVLMILGSGATLVQRFIA